MANEQSLTQTTEILIYFLLAIIVLTFSSFLIIRLRNSLCKKVQSELAFQHRRINDTFTAADGFNVEIMNPIFNLDNANNDAEERIELESEFSTGSFIVSVFTKLKTYYLILSLSNLEHYKLQ